MDDKQLPVPAMPAENPSPTERVVKIGDYLGRFKGYSATLRRRRVLTTRSGKVIDAETLQRARELAPRRELDAVRQLYRAQETGLVASPMPTPPLPDRKEMVIRFTISRLSEPSTWRGILLVLTSIGIVLEPEQMAAITSVGIALAGLVGVFFPDAPKAE